MIATVDSIRKIQINGQVYPITTQYFGFAVGAGQTILAANATQRHRVYAMSLQSSGGAGISFVTIKTGATSRFGLYLPPATGGFMNFIPFIEEGYFETATNEALTIDVVTAAAVINLTYITYTP